MLPRRQSPSSANVLMIVADGVGFGYVSFMAESFEEGKINKTNIDKATPILNQLGESGIVLEAIYGGTLPSTTSADEGTPSQQVRT
jgi:arylsulfatase A-like enzyme